MEFAVSKICTPILINIYFDLSADLHEVLGLYESCSLLVLQRVAPEQLPGEGGQHLPHTPQLLRGVLLKLVLRHLGFPREISLKTK